MRSLRPIEKNIGDNKFLIRKFDPWTNIEVLANLQKRVLGPASGLIAAMSGGPVPTEGEGADKAASDAADNAALQAAIKTLSDALGGPEAKSILKMLIDPDYVVIVTEDNPDGRRFDENAANLYIDDAFDLVELALEVATVNFSTFGKRVRGLIGRLGAMAG